MQRQGGTVQYLDVSKGHTDARQLDADVVGPAVLDQGDGAAARGGQLP